MRYATVTFNFLDNRPGGGKPYIFKTDISDLQQGDIVTVEGIEPGSTSLAVFLNYKAEGNPDVPRKDILKRTHTNTLKAIIRKRYEAHKDVIVTKNQYKAYRKASNLLGLSAEETRKFILRTICVGALIATEKGYKKYYYNNIMVAVDADNEIISINKVQRKGYWNKPKKPISIAEELIGIDEALTERKEDIRKKAGNKWWE